MQTETSESEFEQSVWEISGLSAFEPYTLPQWLRERLEDAFESPEDQNVADHDRVERSLGGPVGNPWIGGWGKALLSGEDVFVFESTLEPFFGFLNHFDVSEMLECGALFVEPSRLYWTGQLMIYTQDRYSVMRVPLSDEHESRFSMATSVCLTS